MDHRGHRGKRLISIARDDIAPGASALSAASPRICANPAPNEGRGSSRSRADKGAGGYRGYITIDPETLVSLRLRAESEASPLSEPNVQLGSDDDEESES